MTPAKLVRLPSLVSRALCLVLALPISAIATPQGMTPAVDVTAYASLQAAIDANPGRAIQLPAAVFAIDRAITITASGTELHGAARLVQANPREPVIRIQGARNVKITGLSVTRADGRQEAAAPAIEAKDCDELLLSNLTVTENHTRSSIYAEASRDVVIANCTVLNYKGFAIDDRTASPMMGYAFQAIDGTGIQLRAVQGAVIRDNRIEEHRIRTDRETHDRNQLGQITVMAKERPRLVSEKMFTTRYTNNWHQGAGIQVADATRSRQVLITGNLIEHAAQGVDAHCDNITISNNIINYCMTGIKAVHGAKNVLINGNQVSFVDLRGIELHAGNASRESANASGTTPAIPENVDGGTIVSNNIFSFFGYGELDWNWRDEGPRHVINITAGPREELPPLRDVLVTGNVVYDNGRDTVLVDGKWTMQPPRYAYALFIEQDRAPRPQNIQVHGNLFAPGTQDRRICRPEL